MAAVVPIQLGDTVDRETREELNRLWDRREKDSTALTTLTVQMATVIKRLDAIVENKRWRTTQAVAILAVIIGDIVSHFIK